jgi:hypothetical protein
MKQNIGKAPICSVYSPHPHTACFYNINTNPQAVINPHRLMSSLVDGTAQKA